MRNSRAICPAVFIIWINAIAEAEYCPLGKISHLAPSERAPRWLWWRCEVYILAKFVVLKVLGKINPLLKI